MGDLAAGQGSAPNSANGDSGTTGPLAPALNTSFDGINFDGDVLNHYDPGTGLTTPHIPPDPNGAAGPAHVVSIVNTSIQWHTKAGTLQNNQRLGKNAANSIVGSFFQSLNPSIGATAKIFDPKVTYDQYRNVGRGSSHLIDDMLACWR